MRWGRRTSGFLTRIIDTIRTLLLEWRLPSNIAPEELASASALHEGEEAKEVDWPSWSKAPPAEVLFNVTEAGEPYIVPMQTDPRLLARPFRPERDVLAEKLRLYGVLSLLNRI